MNSFELRAVGNLAANPELVKRGGKTYCRFCLVGNDYAGKGEEGEAREVTTGLYLVAFNGLAQAIADNARKGDQLIIDAHIRANNWLEKGGETVYDYSYIVDGFKFGSPGAAKRAEFSQAAA